MLIGGLDNSARPQHRRSPVLAPHRRRTSAACFRAAAASDLALTRSSSKTGAQDDASKAPATSSRHSANSTESAVGGRRDFTERS